MSSNGQARPSNGFFSSKLSLYHDDDDGILLRHMWIAPDDRLAKTCIQKCEASTRVGTQTSAAGGKSNSLDSEP